MSKVDTCVFDEIALKYRSLAYDGQLCPHHEVALAKSYFEKLAEMSEFLQSRGLINGEIDATFLREVAGSNNKETLASALERMAGVTGESTLAWFARSILDD